MQACCSTSSAIAGSHVELGDPQHGAAVTPDERREDRLVTGPEPVEKGELVGEEVGSPLVSRSPGMLALDIGNMMGDFITNRAMAEKECP